MSTLNAGLSRALPGLSALRAWKAVHRPRMFGDGDPLGVAPCDAAAPLLCVPATDGRDAWSLACALAVALDVGRAAAWSFGEPVPGRWPVLAATAIPPPPP